MEWNNVRERNEKFHFKSAAEIWIRSGFMGDSALCKFLMGLLFSLLKQPQNVKRQSRHLQNAFTKAMEMKQLEWMKPFPAISVYLYPTGLREVVGQTIVDRASVLELFVLPDRWQELLFENTFAALRVLITKEGKIDISNVQLESKTSIIINKTWFFTPQQSAR